MQNLKSKILAIDFGTKIIGTAINDINLNLCLPYCEIVNNELKFKKIIEIIEEENIKEVVIGFPKTQNSYVSERHQLIIDFKNELSELLKNTNIEICFFDESYSTKSSKESLMNFNIKTSKLKKNKDMIAASIILENYLASKK